MANRLCAVPNWKGLRFFLKFWLVMQAWDLITDSIMPFSIANKHAQYEEAFANYCGPATAANLMNSTDCRGAVPSGRRELMDPNQCAAAWTHCGQPLSSATPNRTCAVQCRGVWRAANSTATCACLPSSTTSRLVSSALEEEFVAQRLWCDYLQRTAECCAPRHDGTPPQLADCYDLFPSHWRSKGRMVTVSIVLFFISLIAVLPQLRAKVALSEQQECDELAQMSLRTRLFFVMCVLVEDLPQAIVGEMYSPSFESSLDFALPWTWGPRALCLLDTNARWDFCNHASTSIFSIFTDSVVPILSFLTSVVFISMAFSDAIFWTSLHPKWSTWCCRANLAAGLVFVICLIISETLVAGSYLPLFITSLTYFFIALRIMAHCMCACLSCTCGIAPKSYRSAELVLQTRRTRE